MSILKKIFGSNEREIGNCKGEIELGNCKGELSSASSVDVRTRVTACTMKSTNWETAQKINKSKERCFGQWSWCPHQGTQYQLESIVRADTTN